MADTVGWFNAWGVKTGVCIQENVTVDQLKDIAAQWLIAHPEARHLSERKAMMPLIAPPHFLIDEIVLVDVLALFLSIATVSFLWYVLKKIFPDEVKYIGFFLTFIIVIVPFVILVYFGGAVINYNAIAIRLDRPEVTSDRRCGSFLHRSDGVAMVDLA